MVCFNCQLDTIQNHLCRKCQWGITQVRLVCEGFSTVGVTKVRKMDSIISWAGLWTAWGWNENGWELSTHEFIRFPLLLPMDVCDWLLHVLPWLPHSDGLHPKTETEQNLSLLTRSLSVFVSLSCFNHSDRNETQVPSKQLNWNNDQVNKKGSPKLPGHGGP